MSLFSELQRRSVFKVGAVYAVVAWLVVQAASIAFPTFEAPVWALRVFIFVVMLGFPIALVLAWAFELTPEGVKVDLAPTGNKRILSIAAAIAALAIGWYYLGQPAVRDSGLGAVDSRSIAVLPFVNMSGDKDNEYFSDGISEEILNSLAQMPDVRVAARTSSFSFKGMNKEVPEIARELEVRMVLEGSVRKQGERVRITAQLIDAERGFHLWSNTYDRELKDIFAIQGEIAQAIAKELEVKLSAAQTSGLATDDTKDLAAYDDYLKGMQLWQARGSDNIRAAEKSFRSALARDPGFAKGWAGLALTLTVLPEWTTEPRDPAWRAARDAAEHALALDPSLPEPYTVLAYVAMSEFRFDTGKAMFARVHALAPSYATAWQWHGEATSTAGDLAEAARITAKAMKLDPKSPIVRQAHVNQLFGLGRDDEARTICEALLKEQPDWLPCSNVLYDIAVVHGDHAAARALITRMATARGAPAIALAEAMSDAVEGRRPVRAVAVELAALPDGVSVPSSPALLSDVDATIWLLALGQGDLALARYQRSFEAIPHGARTYHFDVHQAGLSCLPRYAAMAQTLAITPEQVAATCEASKRPHRAVPPPPKKS